MDAAMSRPAKGMHMDSAIAESPKETYRFLLNGVDATTTGDENFISNERSNAHITSLLDGLYCIGNVYIGDGQTAVVATNKAGDYQEIGILDIDDVYKPHVQTKVLGFKITHQIELTYRVRRGREKVIYWVDGLNGIRTFNFNSQIDFYTELYRKFLEGGNLPGNWHNEKWDESSFNLIKTHKGTPVFMDVDILEYGKIPSGSYNFAVQLVDADLNPTGWLTTSRPVLIFNDYTSKPYKRIRGSKNVITDAQRFEPATKSIQLKIGNLDKEFPFFRVAIIEANATTGQVVKVLVGGLISTINGTAIFTYSGNDEALVEVPVEEIIIEGIGNIIPKHIDQLENKLIVANEIGSKYNWCDFQQYASKIKADLATTETVLNSVDHHTNIKNPHSTFEYIEFMPGEVYSLGISYVMIDGTHSPVFHFPGRSPEDTTSSMDIWEMSGDNIYINQHSCLEGKPPYWGNDHMGHPLTNRQVRHHKFPTRRAVNKPLVSVTSTPTPVNKYQLIFNFTLVGGASWPVDASGNKLSIPYTYTYQPAYAASPFTASSYLSFTDLGKDLIVYDESNDLVVLSGTDYSVITIDTAVITPSQRRATYTITTLGQAVKSELFGLSLTNIEKPHPDVVGFYIVRHERLDTDKCVLDSALFNLNAVKGEYRAFGLLAQKQEDAKIDDKSLWFWSPEHQFLNKKLSFEHIDFQGWYEEIGKDIPTGHPMPNGKFLRLHVVEDVYAGTSYNAEVHKKKEKDDDGFSLVISYRNFRLDYKDDTPITLTKPLEHFYLDAAASRLITPVVYWNVSCDNKIGMVTFDTALDKTLFHAVGDPKRTRWMYGYLTVNNRTSYADYQSRAYYKTHNNPFLFDTGDSNIPPFKPSDSVTIFGGDAHISPHQFVSTVFMDQVMGTRDKKNKTWLIVAGAVLIVAGVVASVIGVGVAGITAGTALIISTLASLAISYGVSLAMSGIKFEQMKNMIDNDYPKGLRDLVEDEDTMYTTKGVNNFPGPQGDLPNNGVPYTDDDAFIWHGDKMGDVWMESSIPYALRSGITAGVTDFIDAPEPNWEEKEFSQYLTDKLTTIDHERGSGRLYKGYPTAEFYDINLDYMRMNKQTLFYHLPIEYNCCGENAKGEVFPVRVRYSEESFQEEKRDNYRAFLPNNYRDIQGEFGEITGLYVVGNQLFIQTPEALWRLPASRQERATSGIVTFIGTGEFFAMPPQRVSEDHLISGGTEHKWATVKTKAGVVSVSEALGKVHIHDGQSVKDIVSGMNMWFLDHLKSNLASQMQILSGVKYPLATNPANPDGVGIHATYDSELERVIITKRDYKFLQSSTPDFQIIKTPPTPLGVRFPLVTLGFYRPYLSYSTETGLFYRGVDEQEMNGDVFRTYEQIPFSDMFYFENKSWTLSYSIMKGVWRSFHSYLPLHYISKPKSFYSLIDNRIWRHNQDGHFQTFYGFLKPHILEYVSAPSPLVENIWNSVKLYTTATRYSAGEQEYYSVDVTFNKMVAWNRKQSTVEWNLKPKQNEAPLTYMMSQVQDNIPGQILISKEENTWNIDDFRDYRVNYQIPVFRTDWLSVATDYPIDKVLNLPSVDEDKVWHSLESLRDTYMALRLTFDNFDNVSLTTNYVIDFQTKSIQ